MLSMLKSNVACCLLAFVILSTAEGWLLSRRRSSSSVCYGRWGCFSTRAPFSNTGHRPRAPERLGVRFYLYTREHTPRSSARLELDWSDQRMAAVFHSTRDTRVIVHGYRDGGFRPWVQNMVRALLQKADQNVVVVDWERGARSLNYLQVAADTRLVGKMVGAMLEKWTRVGARASSFHLIGASLGAHIAGYAGSELHGVGRITGLDPAGPSFENTSPVVRLDPNDALFVDVIHTNAVPLAEMGLGFIDPCGTVDFYPNGGRHQPGCHHSLLHQLAGIMGGENVREAMGCSHLRAVDYFLHSITSRCHMTAHPCSFPQVMSRRHRCPRPRHCRGCAVMGYDVDLNASGVFMVRTRAEPPYCGA